MDQDYSVNNFASWSVSQHFSDVAVLGRKIIIIISFMPADTTRRSVAMHEQTQRITLYSSGWIEQTMRE
jgi:hypothetical protein